MTPTGVELFNTASAEAEPRVQPVVMSINRKHPTTPKGVELFQV